MDKLYQYGVHGIPHKLIKSYLLSRPQQVKVTHITNNQLKEYLSSSLPARSGVPQGSVFGPLLYISDLPHRTQERTIMYADDTSILNIGQDINKLQKPTSENTDLGEQYFETIKLSTKPTETHYILFQTKEFRQDSELKILIRNKEIA
jgi:hypothetical protein